MQFISGTINDTPSSFSLGFKSSNLGQVCHHDLEGLCWKNVRFECLHTYVFTYLIRPQQENHCYKYT